MLQIYIKIIIGWIVKYSTNNIFRTILNPGNLLLFFPYLTVHTWKFLIDGIINFLKNVKINFFIKIKIMPLIKFKSRMNRCRNEAITNRLLVSFNFLYVPGGREKTGGGKISGFLQHKHGVIGRWEGCLNSDWMIAICWCIVWDMLQKCVAILCIWGITKIVLMISLTIL